jgi:hypothetical protein
MQVSRAPLNKWRERGLLAVLVLLSAPAMADWKQDYARGLEAAKKGNWEDVDRYMKGALAGSAEPVERLRLYGQRFEVYAPQHYAGMAALRQGDCTAALRYWSQGGNESFVRGIPDLAEEEQQGRAECKTLLVRQGKPATPPIAQETPVAKPPPEPAPAPTRPVVVAQAPVRPAEPPPSRPPVIEQPAANAVSIQILRPLVDAYLDGRYSDVLKLSTSVPPTSRLRWHMLTLRAAAAFNLAELGESADAAKVARQAASEARKAEPGLKPDSNYFSPKFLSFYAGR